MLGISYWQVPESRGDEGVERLDWLGAALATIGFGAVVYGLIESSRLGFAHPLVLVALGGGGAVLGLFVLVEARSRNPMLPLTLFRSRNFAGANLLTLFLYTALTGAMFFLPLNLIQVQGYSATKAGAGLLPFILIMFILSRWSGGLVKRYGAKLPLVAGPIVAASGYVLFIVPGVGAGYWTSFFPAVAVLGLGMALSVAPLTTTVMNAVESNRAGVASGVNNAVSRAAGLFGIAILGIVMLNAYSARLDRRLSSLSITVEARSSIVEQRAKLGATDVPSNVNNETRVELRKAIDDSFVFGFRIVMATAVVLALASALSAVVMLQDKKVRSDEVAS